MAEPTNSNPNPRFEYKEKLAHDEFRLLSRCGEGLDPVNAPTYQLIAVPLRAAPSYLALSYTWGAPLMTPESHAMYDGKTRELVLVGENGERKRMDIQLNLWEAIQALDRTNTESRYYWVDAVCINQDDLDERASQVTRMASIYSSAHHVVLWLGCGFEQKTKALKLWKEVGPKIYDYNEKLKTYTTSNRGRIFDSDWNPRRFEQCFDGHDLTPLLETFQLFITQHSWFHRTWVVQEVVLAHAPVVLWEEHQLNWDYMGAVCYFLSRINQLASDGTFMYEVRRSAALFRSRDRLVKHYRQVVRSLKGGSPTESSTIKMYRPATQSDLIAAFFASLLKILRLLFATEPRDRVYFGFGLVEELHQTYVGTRPLLPQVDYRLRVVTVYQQTMAYLVRQLPCLAVLGYCSPSDIESVSASCPSWVPRFDLRYRYYTGPFAARAGLVDRTLGFPRQIDDDVLTLTGKRLGRLCTLSMIRFSEDELPSDMSDLHLLESILNLVKNASGMRMTSTMMLVEAAAISMLCGSKTNFDVKSEEHPWRAGLCKPQFRKKPGVWYVNQFMDFATVALARVLSRDEPLGRTEDDFSRVNSCYKVADEIREQCQQEKSAEDIQWLSETRTRWLIQCMERNEENKASVDELSEGKDAVVAQNAKAWRDAACAIDRLFRGEEDDPTVLFAVDSGLFGRSRVHAQVGDELWVIGDCPFLLLLRPTDAEDERDSQGRWYRLISPAWASGVMEGELMTDKMIKDFGPVRLV